MTSPPGPLGSHVQLHRRLPAAVVDLERLAASPPGDDLGTWAGPLSARLVEVRDLLAVGVPAVADTGPEGRHSSRRMQRLEADRCLLQHDLTNLARRVECLMEGCRPGDAAATRAPLADLADRLGRYLDRDAALFVEVLWTDLGGSQ